MIYRNLKERAQALCDFWKCLDNDRILVADKSDDKVLCRCPAGIHRKSKLTPATYEEWEADLEAL